jgi:anti-sigma factor RsiW
MFRRHVSRRLAAYLDGTLRPRQSESIERHLEQCAQCRQERERIRLGIDAMGQLPLVEAPAELRAAVEAAFEPSRPRGVPGAPRWRRALIGAIAAMILIAAAYWRLAPRWGPRWEIIRLAGSPVVGAKPLREAAEVGAGEWIETGPGSRARVEVGGIGSVEVEQNTRLRVTALRPAEHRLALARGEIRASISAPPRLFFVDTAAGTAVDLGCEYSLATREDGSGLVHVTRGWVSFEWQGIESLVPAGASCRTRPHAGPGIPYFDDASEALKRASDDFGPPTKADSNSKADNPLDVILREARVRDTLTLWHLLSRVDAPDRERVYDRIAALTPVPAGVSRERALRLDPETLNRWKDALAWTW